MSDALTQTAQHKLEDILTFFGANTTVEAKRDGDTIHLEVSSELSGQLIGHRGETLAALQHLLNMIMRGQTDEKLYVQIDVGGYKAARLERLATKARDLATKAVEEQREIVLPPMNAAERRHVHGILGEVEGVESYSRGEGRDRRLVIKPV